MMPPTEGEGPQSPNIWRRNVVAIIFNEDGNILACNRKDRKGWQCVQGGVEDDDVELLAAAWREIDEEVGLQQHAHGLQFVGTVPPPNGDPTKLRYRFPKYAAPSLKARGFVGQQQELMLFFAPRIAIECVRLVPTPEQAALGAKQEFRGVAWLPFEEFIPKTSEFKQHIFGHMHAAATPMIASFLAEAQQRVGCATCEAEKKEMDSDAPTNQVVGDVVVVDSGDCPSKRSRDDV